MNQLISSVLNRFGLFVGRQIPGRLTGYDLPRDLSLLFDTDSPLCFDIGANDSNGAVVLQASDHSCLRAGFSDVHCIDDQILR